MSFKIVQTVENGGPKLTVVPKLWESKGIVRWPPKNLKYSSKLIKDGNSQPGPDWNSYKCVLKRNYIPTYEEANIELSEMEQNTDTDCNNDNYSVPRTPRSNQANEDNLINFESVAQDLAQNLDNLQPSASDSCTANIYCQQDTIHVFSSVEIQTVISNQGTILEKLNAVVENQKKLALKMASFSIQLEETISKEKERPVNVTLLQDQIGSDDNESFCIRPIENLQQLDMLEANLIDKVQKKKLFKSLTFLCTSTVGGGITCAYKLLDVIFSRDFLCQCSWSGGSKGETSKIPLKNYKNFRKFFFEIVHSWDKTFTDDDAEKFLKLVVRNATKRKAMKGLRQSAKRTRKNVQNCAKEINYRADSASNMEEPAGDVDFSYNRAEPGENREKPESSVNNGSCDEEIDLC